MGRIRCCDCGGESYSAGAVLICGKCAEELREQLRIANEQLAAERVLSAEWAQKCLDAITPDHETMLQWVARSTPPDLPGEEPTMEEWGNFTPIKKDGSDDEQEA